MLIKRSPNGIDLPYSSEITPRAVFESRRSFIKQVALGSISSAALLEMASREYAELEIIRTIVPHRDVSIGIIDVKSYHIETPEEIAANVRRCLQYARPDQLSFSPDCGLSQTARWAARQKLMNMVAGVHLVRKSSAAE